jgi:chromosome segregation ATPase
MPMNEDPGNGIIEDFSLKKLDYCIAIIGGIVVILCALVVQSLFHKTELRDLRTDYETQIRDINKKHVDEINEKEQTISEMRDSLNPMRTALEELSLAVAIEGLDRARAIREVLRKSDQAHASVMTLLEGLKGNCPWSQGAYRFSIEQAYKRCNESLDSCMLWHTKWHGQVSALLADLSQWVPSQLQQVQVQLQQAREDLVPFRRVFGIVSAKISCSEEERKAFDKYESLRAKLAELERINSLLANARSLFHSMGTEGEDTE